MSNASSGTVKTIPDRDFYSPSTKEAEKYDATFTLNMLTYQETLLQSYRGFHFTFQSIVVAIAAAITAQILQSAEHSLFLYYITLICSMFLASLYYGAMVAHIIEATGNDVTFFQQALKKLSPASAAMAQPYIDWDRARTHKKWAPRQARARQRQFAAAWIAWLWIVMFGSIFARIISGMNFSIYSIQSSVSHCYSRVLETFSEISKGSATAVGQLVVSLVLLTTVFLTIRTVYWIKRNNGVPIKFFGMDFVDRTENEAKK